MILHRFQGKVRHRCCFKLICFFFIFDSFEISFARLKTRTLRYCRLELSAIIWLIGPQFERLGRTEHLHLLFLLSLVQSLVCGKHELFGHRRSPRFHRLESKTALFQNLLSLKLLLAMGLKLYLFRGQSALGLVQKLGRVRKVKLIELRLFDLVFCGLDDKLPFQHLFVQGSRFELFLLYLSKLLFFGRLDFGL